MGGGGWTVEQPSLHEYLHASKHIDSKEKEKWTKKYLDFGNQKTFLRLVKILFRELAPVIDAQFFDELDEAALQNLFMSMGYPIHINASIF